MPADAGIAPAAAALTTAEATPISISLSRRRSMSRRFPRGTAHSAAGTCSAMCGMDGVGFPAVSRLRPGSLRGLFAAVVGTRKVLRGGSWATSARLARPLYRNFFTPGRNDVIAGFRTCALWDVDRAKSAETHGGVAGEFPESREQLGDSLLEIRLPSPWAGRHALTAATIHASVSLWSHSQFKVPREYHRGKGSDAMGSLKLAVIDDFYPDPWTVRAVALSLPYADAKSDKEKVYYKGLLTSPYHPYAGVGIELIAQAIGRVVSLSTPVAEFRLLLARADTGDFGRTWIHSDTSAARYAAIVYFNPPDQCQGGTAFYRHREFGWDHMPDPRSHAIGQIAAETGMSFVDVLEKISADGFDIESKWDLIMQVPMQFNRCIVFDSRQFHARTGSFGTSYRDGRLTQNFFFDITGERQMSV